jgi:hypothetical protein
MHTIAIAKVGVSQQDIAPNDEVESKAHPEPRSSIDSSCAHPGRSQSSDSSSDVMTVFGQIDSRHKSQGSTCLRQLETILTRKFVFNFCVSHKSSLPACLPACNPIFLSVFLTHDLNNRTNRNFIFI